LASFGEVTDGNFEERKLIALETIAGAARLWIVSTATSLDATSSTYSLFSSSINRTRRTGMRRKRMTSRIQEIGRFRPRSNNRVILLLALTEFEMHSACSVRTRCYDKIFRAASRI
jgi:hypothetical protein